jgi:1-hydroxycarotenoid 3,4-desaturase
VLLHDRLQDLQRRFLRIVAVALGGHEDLFDGMLRDGPTLTPQALDLCEQTSFSMVARCGLKLSLLPASHLRTDPRDFHQRFPATGGALYGQATHGWMSAFERPGAVTPIQGLFLAGGSVHPGPGVPMAAMSGQQAAAALLASPALTKQSLRAATSGGMSMR